MLYKKTDKKIAATNTQVNNWKGQNPIIQFLLLERITELSET